MAVTAFVENGVLRLIDKGIVPEYDGSYLDTETEDWHDTWLVESDADSDQLYMVDRNRLTKETICTCRAGDFSKQCKHIQLLFMYI